MKLNFFRAHHYYYFGGKRKKIHVHTRTPPYGITGRRRAVVVVVVVIQSAKEDDAAGVSRVNGYLPKDFDTAYHYISVCSRCQTLKYFYFVSFRIPICIHIYNMKAGTAVVLWGTKHDHAVVEWNHRVARGTLLLWCRVNTWPKWPLSVQSETEAKWIKTRKKRINRNVVRKLCDLLMWLVFFWYVYSNNSYKDYVIMTDDYHQYWNKLYEDKNNLLTLNSNTKYIYIYTHKIR